MIRIMTTLAAMLLYFSAFAQSSETLKGDVNGDGKIDVEDVTSVVDIILSGKTYGYFYFGTTEPTEENFTLLPGDVASYTSISEAVGTTVSIAEGETLYMLCPAAWMKGKHVEVEDGEENTYKFLDDADALAISGYVIYQTQAFNEATDVMLKFNNSSAETYYWYVGQTDPSSMNSITPLSSNAASEGAGWRTIGLQSDLDNISSSNKLWDGSIISTGTTKTTNYIALPNDRLFMYDSLGNISSALWITAGTKVIDGVTYYIYSSVANLKSFSNNIY